jgi:hypothetical protein
MEPSSRPKSKKDAQNLPDMNTATATKIPNPNGGTMIERKVRIVTCRLKLHNSVSF